MAEEPGENQDKDTENKQNDNEGMVVCLPNQEKTGDHDHQRKNKSRCHSDGWIVVRSQNRPGFFYDFHVPTGESHWRDQALPVKKVEPHHGTPESRNSSWNKSPKEIPICGFEPTEPTDNPPTSHHDTPSQGVPKIYNKQIINNQFPFGNAPYTQCTNNTAWSAPPSMIYPWALPPPVLINSTVTPFNQAQTVFGPLPNLPAQNTFAPLSTTVPILNQAQTTGFGSLSNLSVQNMSGPFNTPLLNQTQTIVGSMPDLPVQNTSPEKSTMPPLSQAQASLGSMPNLPVQNISGHFSTSPPLPLNLAQTVVGPLPNLPVQNLSAPLNTPPLQPPLNHAQTDHKPLANLPIKNSSVPLSNRFQVLKQFNRKIPESSVKSRLGLKRAGIFFPRNQQNYMRKNSNNPNDLRSLLSGRNRQDLNEEIKEYPAKTQTKEDIPVSLDEDEINPDPDDTDEWLEDNTDDEGKKLTIDMQCIWKLADSTASRESWYIVPTAIVLLNNIRFFTSLVISDERARLLAPLSVIRALRSATFSDNARVADCAKRAMILIRQSSKHPDTPKNQPNVSSCLELIDQNKLVVLLFDEKDKEQREIINDIPKFTVDELKLYLTQNSATNAIAAIQKIENITIVVPNNENEKHSTEMSNHASPYTSVVKREVKTDLTSVKRTANASVQTDFQFTLAFTEKGHEEESKKSETKMDLEVDAGEACKKDIDKKIPPRKIRLKRQHQPLLNISDSHEVKTFKWRKRKDTSTPNSTLSQLDSHKSYSSPSTSTGDLQHLVTQQDDKAAEIEFGDVGVDVQLNDNVMEPAFGDVGVDVQLNDNVVEPAFSDVGVYTKTVDETSTSGVISNSVDSDCLFQIPQAIRNDMKDLSKDSISQKEVVYQITSEFMKEHLSSRCDEWVSRFTQIMEEVLTQVLHMDPPYVDKGLPPPWNVQEATACIKRKFRSHIIIVNASDKFDSFLFKISDDRGNIRTDIRPEDFMKMYSYGVNLVNVLQMVLKHEDLQIASDYLSQLLSDIQEPNLDLSQEFETFCDAGSPNISESITNMSTTDAAGSTTCPTVPAVNESPQHEEKRSSCNDSPARYSLRSSQKSSSAHNKQKEDNRTEVVCDGKNDEGYSLFSSLGLQKNNFKPDKSIVKTIINVPQDQTHQTSPTIQTDLVPDNKQEEHKIVNVAEPKIIRNFNVFPNIENKLEDMNNVITEVDYALREEYMSEDNGLAEDVDFTKDETIEYGAKGKINALNLSVYIATCAIQRCIMISRKFCEETYNNLKSVDSWEPHYKADVMGRTTKVGVLLENVCDRLKRILNRDPSVTKDKFRIVMNELGTPGDMNDTQLAEYRTTIEKYLEDVNYLQKFVTLLDAAIKKI